MPKKKLHLSTVLLAVVLALLISYSAMMTMAGAFGLQADWNHLLLACGLLALLASLSMLPKRAWILSLTALVLAVFLAVWQWEALWRSVQAVVWGATSQYAQAFPKVAVMGTEGDSLFFLCLLALPLAWLTAWVVCRQGHVLFLFLACGPVLVLVLAIVDLAPVFWLVLLVFGLLLLLLSSRVRERSANEAGRLVWWLILPASILITSITVLWPPADYERQDWSEVLQEFAEGTFRLGEAMEALPGKVTAMLPALEKPLDQVDLGRLGPKILTGRPVLRAKAQDSQYFLRGASLGIYEDNTWKPADRTRYPETSRPEAGRITAQGTKTLEVETLRTEDVIYTAYMVTLPPETAAAVDDVCLENAGKLRSYQVGYQWIDTVIQTPEYENYVNQEYTQVPPELGRELESFLARQGWTGGSPEELVGLIHSLAVYDLNTAAVPRGEDFILHFLETGRGYCVHFATAVTMLLRTQGIPARYVTGYSVSGPTDQWIDVTEDDAHAWVEYYAETQGQWYPLEATPSAYRDHGQAAPAPEAPAEPQTPDQVPEDPEEGPEPPVPEESETPFQEEPLTKPVQGEQKSSRLWLLLLPCLVLLVLIRRWTTVWRRKERCRKGHPNRRALALWRWLVHLAREEGVSIEEELICLAEKARFSQHTLEEAEVELLQLAVETRINRLKQRPLGKQLWYRYGSVLY